MKNQLLFIFTIFCFHFPVCAQELITDEGIRLKPGIYRNFKEFVTNSPSLYPEVGNHSSKTNSDNSWFKLTLPDGVLTKGDSIWGFCTGRNVYINGRKDFLYKKGASYHKLLYIGRYCYYEIHTSATQGNPGPNGTMSTGTSEIIKPFIIDINDGSKDELSDEWFLLTLQIDSELLQEYEAKSYAVRKNMYKYYIKRYSERNWRDIERKKLLNQPKG